MVISTYRVITDCGVLEIRTIAETAKKYYLAIKLKVLCTSPVGYDLTVKIHDKTSSPVVPED